MAEAVKYTGFAEFSHRNRDVFLAIILIGVLALLLIPLPTMMLDFLLAINITISILVFLSGLYLEKAVEFSVFPSLLLFTTLFRLGLNISSTRLVLLHGSNGMGAAGKIIETFGAFVVGGNYIVGIVMFIILVMINFVVITKGSTRIAEVAARFTLDALPGKQMAIDADLNAGVIDDVEAKKRRKEIRQEADFFGAMDGASKFVRGDAVAGLIITGINIVGGLILGTLQQGMDIATAAQTFTVLTIGDGLVSQIPALIISTAAGMVVTRAADDSDLSMQMLTQLAGKERNLMIAAGVITSFGLIPGMPFLAFLFIGGSLYFMAYSAKNRKDDAKKEKETKAAQSESIGNSLKRAEETIESLLPLDLMEVELGFGLIALVDEKRGGDLLKRIQSLRKQFATQIGIIVPPIHIRDNLELGGGEYNVLLKGNVIAKGTLMPERLLAMASGEVTKPIAGHDTKEPAFGLPAKWITKETQEHAEAAGYTVVDCSTVIATHITELVRGNAQELIGRQELQELLDIFKSKNPKVIEELIPDLLHLGDVLQVLKNLLREKLSVRDLRTILECLADHAKLTKNIDTLTELVRQRMSKHITSEYKSRDGTLYVMNLNRQAEDFLREGLTVVDDKIQLAVDPIKAGHLLEAIQTGIQEFEMTEYQPVLLVSPELRRPLFELLEKFIPNLTLLSIREIDPHVQVQALKTIKV